MDTGVLKSFALYLPILAWAIWEVVRLSRDPELRNRDDDEESEPPSGSDEPEPSAESRHAERE